MPSPRATRGRDFTAVALEFDPTDSHEAAYATRRRADSYGDRAPAGGDKYRARRRTSAGWAVELRNGLPFRPYRICNACGRRGHLETEHADV
jgi:hypothetical protein